MRLLRSSNSSLNRTNFRSSERVVHRGRAPPDALQVYLAIEKPSAERDSKNKTATYMRAVTRECMPIHSNYYTTDVEYSEHDR